MHLAAAAIRTIYHIVTSCTDSPIHTLLKQNYIQSLRVLLNITLGSIDGLLGIWDDLFYKLSRPVAFYCNERSVQCLWNTINPHFDRR